MDNKYFCHLHTHTEFCLSGDAIIYNCRNHHQNGKIYRTNYTNLKCSKTIKELYDSLNKKHKGGTTKYNVKTFDGEKFVKSKIKKITKSPSKQLYKLITEKGKEIRTSKEHKFLTIDGWKRLKDLKVGMLLACNGQLLYESEEWLYKKYKEENLNQQQIADLCSVDRRVIGRRIKKFNLNKTKSQWMQNHYVSKETCNKLKKIHKQRREELKKTKPSSLSCSRDRIHRWHIKKEKCELCYKNKAVLTHHKDEDPLNNNDDNLIDLCKSCHEKQHSNCPETIRYEKITEIKKDKIEETYDIEVYHKSHNFVANGFVVHNSLLDALGSCKKYAKKAKGMGFKSLAVTDHGNIDSLIQFQKACKNEGIKPILGSELYLVENPLEKPKKEKRSHIITLVKNEIGFKNLCTLLNKANIDGFYRRPRIGYDNILDHCEGLIIMTACVGGFLNTDYGMDLFWDLDDRIGEDLYLEIMPHNHPLQEKVNNICLDIHREYPDIKLVASQDVHYINKSDSKAQEVLLAVNSRVKWNDPKRFKFDEGFDELYLKSANEMIISFEKLKYIKKSEYISAIHNTMEVAEKCNFEIKKREITLPVVKRKQTGEEYLKEICMGRFLDIFHTKVPNEYFDRFEREFEMLKKKKFIPYFLMVYELIEWCNENDIMVGDGRGCFLPNSKILTKDGLKNIQDIKIGDYVLSHDETLNIVENTFEYLIKEEIVEIECEDGRMIKCTSDHKILINSNGNKIWVMAKNLKENDNIVDLSLQKY